VVVSGFSSSFSNLVTVLFHFQSVCFDISPFTFILLHFVLKLTLSWQMSQFPVLVLDEKSEIQSEIVIDKKRLHS